MSRTTVCDRCGRVRESAKEPWLAVVNFGLEVDFDLCRFCVDELVDWMKR